MDLRLESNRSNVREFEDLLSRMVFLSYHIANYKNISESIGFDNCEISIDEIHDFIQDLKYEINEEIPSINKRDINYCLCILKSLGICHLK
ncbi:MAG TPA: hypothetical protein VLA74_11955 [Nitrososphaeraceae archaeon]|nr:hypothetical protein [Nitrososphaeraceae archaeon]